MRFDVTAVALNGPSISAAVATGVADLLAIYGGRIVTSIELCLTSDQAQRSTADEVFLWDGTAGDSFHTGLRPDLRQLGMVPSANADFVRLALTVYTADHSVLRQHGGSNWNERDLTLTVPAVHHEQWNAAAAGFERTLAFLSGDSWTLQFVPLRPPSEDALVPDTAARTVLVSGGADSASGALVSAATLMSGQTQRLVSHSSSGSGASAPQARVATALEQLYPGTTLRHHQVHLQRRSRRLSGTRFRQEPSSRSRSLLFLALGLAVASQSGRGGLWIAENGFASINPPLGPERVGALSTRTTQPGFCGGSVRW